MVKSEILASSYFRPKSLSVEDTSMGDSGKGVVTAQFNHILGRNKPVFSLRFNGGANAGHETYVHGQKVVTHQLPMGVVAEGATALITRGMVLHPPDLVTEIELAREIFGGSLPGNLIIDENTPMLFDYHRAGEYLDNLNFAGGRGSTSSGIARAYLDVYNRHAILLKDFLDHDWKDKLGHSYEVYYRELQGSGLDLADIEIVYLVGEKRAWKKVGSKKEFIGSLEDSRDKLSRFASKDARSILQEAWDNPNIAFTIEAAQAPGLDPYHGVYPDVTASRPLSRFIGDATYNIILPEEIALRLGVMKTIYMSSVGQRVLPTIHDKQWESQIQKECDEVGRTTGKPRQIFPISIPMMRYLKRAAGYQYLAATHLDAAKEDRPIKVITHYTDKTTGQEKPYSPYQRDLDQLDAHTREFASWDGAAIKQVKSPKDLPQKTTDYLEFLGQTIAPVVFGTYGRELEDYISWIALK